MAQVQSLPQVGSGSQGGFGATQRKDNWWTGPIVTGVVLGSFVVYATFRAFYNAGYHVGHGTGVLEDHAYLLSPFYSPLIILPWLPAWISPALLILWAPGGFRVTCYYYRKAYYRAFFLDPVGCAVGEPNSMCGIPRGHKYRGETGVLIFQNLHRYFLYLALLFLIVLAIDVVHACIWPTPSHGFTFGVSVGTLVLLANVVLLTMYTFSCHSLRHLIGGRLDSFSRSPLGPTCYKMWNCASALNKNHMLWAWASLFGVALADLYVWLVALGVVHDFRFF